MTRYLQLLAMGGIAAVCAFTMAACGGGGASGFTEDMLRLFPRDTQVVTYVGVSQLYDDDDLRTARREIEDQWERTSIDSDFDIELEDLTYVVFGFVDYAPVVLMDGLEDLDDLRDELDDGHYDEDEYRNVEVWLSDDYRWGAVAFLGGGRVLLAQSEATMEDVLRRLDRGSSSLYDEAEDIIAELPAGIIVLIVSCDNDCLSGNVIAKQDADALRIVSIARYEDEDDAENGEEDIEDDIDDGDYDDCDDVDVDRSGRRVTVEMTCRWDYFEEFVVFSWQ